MLTKADIEKYFLAEKQLGLIFFIIGILAVAFALVFFFVWRSSFYKGAAIPLLLIGLVELTIGFVIYRRSDADRTRNVYAYDMNPQELKERELPRLQKVRKSFVIYKWTWVALMIAGMVLTIVFRTHPGKTYRFGLGTALTIQTMLMLGADYFAEKRAKDYMEKLQAFTAAGSPSVR